ncbi:hypothetical protein ACHAW6_010265 [Cyclotella cf. meneghiniana]
MELLTGYTSSNDDDDKDDKNIPQPSSPPSGQTTLRRPLAGSINAAPLPSVPIAVLRSKGLLSGGPVALSTGSNLHQLAVQGPALLNDPNDAVSSFVRAIDPKTGSTAKIAADAAADEFIFAKNRNAFQRGPNNDSSRHDAALAPGEVAKEIQRNEYGHDRHFPPNYGVVPPVPTEEEHDDDDDRDAAAPSQLVATSGQKRPLSPPPTKSTRRARREQQIAMEGALVHDDDDELAYGIWAPPSASERNIAADSVTAVESGVELHPRIKAERAYLKERDRQRGLMESVEEREKERKMAHLLPPRLEGENPEAVEPTTVFHQQEEIDYRGRSWILPPSGVKGVDPLDTEDHACYVPKKCVFRFTGHTKGVHRIRLFPRTGHLLLSAGLDGSCKVWSVQQRQVMRTYTGHTAAVRDVQFNNDGTKFVSASFDRYLRLWDTESGKVLGTYTNRRVPYVVKFYPHDDNIFVVGCSDNKIVAYDATTGEITQEYDHHLAPVNTITFVEDNGTKMVTSSDDKKVLVWEWDIGVPIKYISDPTMHSMPVITMHPSEKYLICQSLDNKILVYQAGERYSLQRKKKMEGHNTAGYACDITVSPDGRFVCSGDADGKICFWDFKKTRMLQKYHAHDKGPAIGAVWHPVEPSVVFTCGWDGVIKMWQ